MLAVYFSVSLLASTIGSICGIGGGIIIKVTLDLLQVASVSTISFLSGCTVLSMSLYSIIKNFLTGNNTIELKKAIPLAIGSSIGGIIGKEIFSYISNNVNSMEGVGIFQSAILSIITLGTLLYVIFKHKITTHNINSKIYCSLIGFGLGCISSFLGIGGGPINIIVLHFFFSMDTRHASQNSLYIILFSQTTSIVSSLITKSIPSFSYASLILMVIGGVLGGVIGRMINIKINNRVLEKIFIAVIIITIIISIFNAYQYSYHI